MDPRTPRTRALWRGLALAFAISVVALRLGIAGCSPAFFGPTKAGGGFNGAQQAAPPPASTPANAPIKSDGQSNPNVPAKSNAVREPALRDPAFFPPTKAAGGFYAVPSDPPAPAPPQASPRQAPTATQQAPNPER